MQITITPSSTTDIKSIPQVKQTLRYQTKENLQRIEDLRGCPTEEDTNFPPDTPTTNAVPSTAEIPMVVTTITTTGPTSITTIVDNTGTTTTTIISTVVLGINIKSRNIAPTTDIPPAVASTQLVINIDSDIQDRSVLGPIYVYVIFTYKHMFAC
jgi:hypothetical protein